LAATSLPASERFTAIEKAGYGEVLRGVSFTPGTDLNHVADDHDDGREQHADAR
jgi:hypothetical protein